MRKADLAIDTLRSYIDLRRSGFLSTADPIDRADLQLMTPFCPERRKSVVAIDVRVDGKNIICWSTGASPPSTRTIFA